MRKARQRNGCCFHDGFPRAGRSLRYPAFHKQCNMNGSSAVGYAARRGRISLTQANISRCFTTSSTQLLWIETAQG